MSGGTAAVKTATLWGAEAVLVTVEVSTSGGLPGIDIVGSPDGAVLEARTRVRCALREVGFEEPRCHVTVNLAPGQIKKQGTGFDLPIAVAVLIATHQLHAKVAEGALFVGELGLEGDVIPGRGDVAYAQLAEREGLVLVTSVETPLPAGWRGEVRCLARLTDILRGLESLPHVSQCGARPPCCGTGRPLDFADVSDQELPKRAMTIAAAGGHGMLMVGPPGAGKTMLARRMPTILPPLSEDELAEVMLIHSVAGQPLATISQGKRPFRAPHHSISKGGLVGGGRPVLPGEISLAHRGVIFLDELPEFDRNALQSMRQPLEDGFIHLSRVDGAYTFPADFQLIAAANPCPCGHLGDPGHECRCAPARIVSYQGKIGGPLMDRIDVVIDVARPKSRSVIKGAGGTSSEQMALMVAQAREFASWRAARADEDAPRDPVASACLDLEAEELFEGMCEQMALGGRGIVRVARVARTIADLEERDKVIPDDIVEAIGYRSRNVA